MKHNWLTSKHNANFIKCSRCGMFMTLRYGDNTKYFSECEGEKE